MKVFSILVFSAVTALTSSLLAAKEKEKTKTGIMHMHMSKARIELKLAMRQLWEEHVLWTRNYVISAVADLGDTAKVVERLLKNQDEIGNAIKPYYGVEAGNKLASLLRSHILIAADVVKAAKTNNSEQLAMEQKKWHTNADEISAFLSTANPNWKLNEIKDDMYSHLAILTDEVSARIQKDWNSNIESFDRSSAHMRMFADKLSDGIIKQFPNKF